MGDNNHHIESDRRLVTVMFADISGFTAISEKMDPEEVTDIMNECFRFMGECIEQHGGTIDKFIGDCVMALFGAPKTLEDGPHRAIETALEMKNRLSRFNEDKRLPIPLSFHIGINTGSVIAGMVGSDLKQDFTVMGDTVNLASRMESAAETGSILVSENTYRLTEGYFDFEPIGEVKVKGKEQPVKAYKVLGPRRIITRVAACQEKGLSPFVGRNKELEHLKDRLAQASEGHGQVVGAVGEPGVGKSRLIRQFRESLPAEEYTCIEGGCIHFGDSIPYLPILDMLKDYFDISEDDNETTIKKKMNDRVNQLGKQLGHILPPLHEVLSLKVENEEYVKLDAKQRRDKVFETIRLLLIVESQKNPLVVIIEDLHWMDKTSEDFLISLINSLATTKILLILLFRPEYTPSWAGKTYYSQIRVDQLPRRTIEDLVMGILGCGDVEPELIEFIANRTEGNPLFIEELTFNLLENGSIKKDGNRHYLSLRASDIQVPATIQGIIAARLDRLEGKLRGIMQTASVIGREFAFRILQTVASLREDLKSSLLTLQDLEFIYEKSFFPELEYIFKHALTQEVAYNSQLIKKRKETHERVGQAIELIYADRLEEFFEMLAYHYTLSENGQKACQYLRFSGDKAAKNYANWEAVKYYREAVRVMDCQQEDTENKHKKFRLLMSLFGMMNFFGMPEGTLQELHEAERIARDLNDPKLLAAAYGTLTYYHTQTGNLALSTEYSEKSFYLAEQTKNIDQMIKIGGAICSMYWTFGDYTSSAEFGCKAIKSLEDNKKFNLFQSGLYTYSNISGYCGGALGCLGRLDEARYVFDKALVRAIEINDKFGIGFIEFMHSIISCWEGDGNSTCGHTLKALKQFDDAGVNALEGVSWIASGQGHFLLGDYEISREHAEKGLEIQKRIGLPFVTAWSHWYLAVIYFFNGDLEKTREHAELALRLSQETSAKPCEGVSWILLGCQQGKTDPGSFNKAYKNILHGISLLHEMKALPHTALGLLLLGEFLADADKREDAKVNLKKAENLYLEMKVTPKSYWLKRAQDALAKLGSTH